MNSQRQNVKNHSQQMGENLSWKGELASGSQRVQSFFREGYKWF